MRESVRVVRVCGRAVVDIHMWTWGWAHEFVELQDSHGHLFNVRGNS